jgi:hypothetical protein
MALIPMLEGRAAMFAVVWSGVGGIGRSCVDEGGEFTPPLSSLRKSILRDNDKVQSNREVLAGFAQTLALNNANGPRALCCREIFTHSGSRCEHRQEHMAGLCC